MKIDRFNVILTLILVLAIGIYLINANFDFFKKISADILNTTSSPKIIKVNKHLVTNTQRGVYSTVWSARSKKINDLITLTDKTEVNAIVIDVKDSGDYIDEYVKNLVGELHKKNIYAIARIIIFQDGSQIKIHPDWYFKRTDGSFWRDNRGWYWMNPENREVWDYNISIAKKAVDAGFDEINFDYIRFPVFTKYDNLESHLASASAEVTVDKSAGKPAIAKNIVIDQFALYLTSQLKNYDPDITLSVDLFAYNMLKKDDLGIGQNFREIYDYFDYISPMIYPSHYLPGNFGFNNPAEHPYETVLKTIESGKNQLREKIISESGTTTPAVINPILDKKMKKLRPWLQDFNIGAIYDGGMIRKEKKAVYDAGLTSGWLLWNPRNVYTEGALDK